MSVLSVLLLGWLTTIMALPDSEIASLKAIYQSTGGPGWTNSANWMSNNISPCSWKGVLCDEWESHVISIQLDNNNLVGTLPHLDFPGLMYLNLNLNAFTGPLPDMSALVSLTTLWLFGCGITGPIPPLPPSIGFINMQSNAMTGEIPPFTNNTLIITLQLDGNKFTGAIPEFKTLSQLRRLYLGGNLLTSMPASFAHNPLLEELDISDGYVTGPMSDISHNTQLTRLNLIRNKLTGELPSFAPFTKLTYVNLFINQFNGSLPIISSPVITFISFGDNYFTGPVSFTQYANCSSLTSLDISCNYLTPPVPTWPAGHTSPQLGTRCFDGTGDCLNCHLPPAEVYFID